MSSDENSTVDGPRGELDALLIRAGRQAYRMAKGKPLSPRRAREFRDRQNKRRFGDRKKRAERFAWLTKLYGKDAAVQLSRLTLQK